MPAEEKMELFSSIISTACKCDLCPRMCERKRVLSELNGNINTKVIFVAEAPGRLGAESTGIPLFGDATGNNFETFLSNIGWSRNDVFITNAILCNPQDNDGKNDTPTKEEICNCSYYLNMVLELIKPDVLVTIGAKALEALSAIVEHHYTLKNDVAKLVPWNGMYIFPMYHMSPRAAIHRSLIQQRSDFIALSHEVSPKSGLKKNGNRSAKPSNSGCVSSKRPKLLAMAEYIVSKYGSISFFKLTKVLYLCDLYSLKDNQRTISDSIYLRMQEGPWIPNLKNIVKESIAIQTTGTNGRYILACTNSNISSGLDDDEKKVIDSVIEKTLEYSDRDIKTTVYLTAPMKYVLREEKKGRSMLKIPIIYNNKTIVDMDNPNTEPV